MSALFVFLCCPAPLLPSVALLCCPALLPCYVALLYSCLACFAVFLCSVALLLLRLLLLFHFVCCGLHVPILWLHFPPPPLPATLLLPFAAALSGWRLVVCLFPSSRGSACAASGLPPCSCGVGRPLSPIACRSSYPFFPSCPPSMPTSPSPGRWTASSLCTLWLASPAPGDLWTSPPGGLPDFRSSSF